MLRAGSILLLLLAGSSCHHTYKPPPAPVHIGTLKVLFIGNSYTSTNDLPGSFKAMAASAGAESVQVDSLTVGGATLEQLWGSGVPAKIALGGWTQVVIQGQSVEPCGDPATFLTYAAKMADAAKAVGATPVFYETWPRKAGDALYAQPWSGSSPEGMLHCLHDNYAKAVSASGGLLAPAGDAWMKALDERPDYALYQSDGSHPLAAGTYLVAAVMLETIAHTPATQADWVPSAMNPYDKDWLAGIAAAP